MDVFANLDKFLEKNEDSFKYDSFSAQDSSEIASEEPSSSQVIDLSDWEVHSAEKPAGRKRKNRSDKNREPSPVPDASFDLTDPAVEISPPKRNRRAADEVSAMVVDTVDLNAQEEESVGVKTRRTAGLSKKAAPKQKKAPKPKRLTYKQALAAVNAPIPQLPEQKIQEAPVGRLRSVVTNRSFDVDLTGDVELTEKHSSAPLFQKQDSKMSVQVVESSEDEDDDEMDLNAIKVKVKTVNRIKSYPYRLNQRYYDLFKILAEQENIPVSSIYLFDGDTRILTDDTPSSTNYKISTILHCRVMHSNSSNNNAQISKTNLIELKFQSDKWKKPIALKVSKLSDFSSIVATLCEQIEFKPEQVSLKFDGDVVDMSETPVDLEFEGGEIIDCKIKC